MQKLFPFQVKAGVDVCFPLFSNSETVTSYNYGSNPAVTSSQVSGPSSYACVHLQVAF